MSSLRAKAVRAVTGAWFKTVNAEKADVRSVWHFLAKSLWTASGVDVRKATIAGMPSEWHTPQAPDRGKVILYLHGGAYVMGNFTTHRQIVSYIARACRVLIASCATMDMHLEISLLPEIQPAAG